MKRFKSLSSIQLILIVLALLLVGFLVVLPSYLGPDDLAKCSDKPDTQKTSHSCQTADAIVALSGGDTAARTGEAIKLYKNGWADKLVFSGAAQDKSGPSNAQAMRKQALFQGVPPESILIEEDAVNTEQNASRTQNIIRSNNLNKIILVTSAYHQRRASLEFKKRVGEINVVNHPIKNDKQWSKKWYLTPGGWWLALGEMVKIVGFYISG